MSEGAAAGWYVFFAGVAVGGVLLASTAYAHVSPAWLKWLLLASAALAVSRYVSMTVFAVSFDPSPPWLWSRCYYATTIALTFPGFVAMDQLVRHPAITPKKVVMCYAPFFIMNAAVLLCGTTQIVPHPLVGGRPRFTGAWPALLGFSQAAFLLCLFGAGVMLMRKLPASRIKFALGILLGAYAVLGICGVFAHRSATPLQPYLWAELLTFAAIWFALDTARHSTV